MRESGDGGGGRQGAVRTEGSSEAAFTAEGQLVCTTAVYLRLPSTRLPS